MWEQDSSSTRQLIDTDLGDSSPAELKTVHGQPHFSRQFTDTFIS